MSEHNWKIVIAPNALKGSLTAHEAASAMAHGIRNILPHADLVLLPVADGGDGLLQVLKDTLQMRTVTKLVSGPLGDPVNATFLYDDVTHQAIIEMAEAAGLVRISPEQYNPMLATTYGVGELIIAAIELGAKKITLGIGGSATNDGGTGMVTALGVVFLDASGLALPGNGESLSKIESIDIANLDSRLSDIEFQVICDVDNPLLGEKGAANVFAPQKGASPEQVLQLDTGLAQLADVIEKDLGYNVRDIPGSGAAGGLGAGLIAFLQANLKPGAEVVLDLIGFTQQSVDAQLIITSEGQLDSQTVYGKVPAVVALQARSLGIPCLAIAGSLGTGFQDLHNTGIDAAFSLCPGPVSLTYAMQHAKHLLSQTTEQAVRCFISGFNATNSDKSRTD